MSREWQDQDPGQDSNDGYSRYHEPQPLGEARYPLGGHDNANSRDNSIHGQIPRVRHEERADDKRGQDKRGEQCEGFLCIHPTPHEDHREQAPLVCDLPGQTEDQYRERHRDDMGMQVRVEGPKVGELRDVGIGAGSVGNRPGGAEHPIVKTIDG